MTVINSFTGEYKFLSNFYTCAVVLDGEKYWSVEHAYQAAKTLDLKARAEIRIADTFARAKRLGRRVTMRSDWHEIRLAVMEDLLRQKFSNPENHRRLLLTGHAQLVEGNSWHDHFWGVCEGRGENNLGKLLMKIRDEKVQSRG